MQSAREAIFRNLPDLPEITTEAESNFNRYKDHELIASGGMKDVYKVYDSQNRRHIAMAKLRSDVPDEQCEDFFREAYLTASLEHPNIISLYDIGVDNEGVPFFTMELKSHRILNS